MMKSKRKVFKISLVTGHKSKTYQEIFQEIEEQYFNGINKNTKRNRSRSNINDQNSFNRTKLIYFNKISDWNECPTVESLKTLLYSFTPGTKSFKDAFYLYKQIASKATNNQELIKFFIGIDTTQVVFQQKQSVSWNDFFSWYKNCRQSCNGIYSRWLWVSAMSVVYDLRPSEVAASQNLTKPWVNNNVIIPPVNDFGNKNMLLVIGEKTYFGATTKTGLRIARPMIMDENIFNQLGVRNIMLPKLNSNSSNPNGVGYDLPTFIDEHFHVHFTGALDRFYPLIEQVATKFHPVKDYLKGLPVQDSDFIDDFIKRSLQITKPIHVLMVRKWLIGAARRILSEKPVKFDNALILQGVQGIGKSTFFEALAGAGFFTDDMRNISDKDEKIKPHYSWMVGCSELENIFR